MKIIEKDWKESKNICIKKKRINVNIFFQLPPEYCNSTRKFLFRLFFRFPFISSCLYVFIRRQIHIGGEVKIRQNWNEWKKVDCSHFICIEMLSASIHCSFCCLFLFSPFSVLSLYPVMHVIWKVCLCNDIVIKGLCSSKVQHAENGIWLSHIVNINECSFGAIQKWIFDLFKDNIFSLSFAKWNDRLYSL
jgi:hypothetical protein